MSPGGGAHHSNRPARGLEKRAMMKRITIDPITRLEGHGRIEIFLNGGGEVENAYFQVPELRGFEEFCRGRPVEEMPRITTRICGVCPSAHHMASAKAVDAVYHVEPPVTARKLRELLYSAFYAGDHGLHFYYLGGPDFVVGPKAPAAERNILGVIGKVGLEIGKRVIRHRAECQEAIGIVGGKAIHPVCAVPGGVSKPISEAERTRLEEIATNAVEFGQFSLKLFDDVVLANSEYVDLIQSEPYSLESYYMGLVDEHNRVNFYDGQLRIVHPDGEEVAKFPAEQYLNYLAEHVEPWTYLKFPYLKKVGWRGLVEGPDNGIYRVAPLARLNAADGMATPLAQAEYERMYSVLGEKPVHATLAQHWARLIEMLYAAERMLELSRDPEITGTVIRTMPSAEPREGVGVVEAPRGTLIHHYRTDPHGLVERANLIVGTGNNYAAICLSIKKAAAEVLRGEDTSSEGLLNMVEMAFRAYDPCLACATHALSEGPTIEIAIRGPDGELLRTIRA